MVGTRGGVNRALIVNALTKKPYNTNQLTELLRLDYKTVQHHLKVLEKNGLVAPVRKGEYGSVYFLAPELEENIEAFREVWEQAAKLAKKPK